MATYSPQPDSIRPFLKSNTFLGQLPDAALDALIRRGQTRSHAKGAFIYRRGAPGDSLMVVITGRAKLANTNVDGKEVVLHFLGAGDVCGELALDGKERAADAIVLEDADVFVLAMRDLLPTLAAHPDTMLAIIRELCEKFGPARRSSSTARSRCAAARRWGCSGWRGSTDAKAPMASLCS
jgi:CRP-like cAMP-binding protein